MSELRLFKLISGEEVVGKVVNETDSVVELDNAVALVYHQVAEGKMSVGFAPFMPYAEGAVKLKQTSVAASAPPTDQIAQEHIRVFSGIVVAPAGSKIA
jgi:hypothetical protein